MLGRCKSISVGGIALFAFLAGCGGNVGGQIPATPEQLLEFQIQQQKDYQATLERIKNDQP